MTRAEWKQICTQLNKWVNYFEIEKMDYEKAVEYIKTKGRKKNDSK